MGASINPLTTEPVQDFSAGTASLSVNIRSGYLRLFIDLCVNKAEILLTDNAYEKTKSQPGTAAITRSPHLASGATELTAILDKWKTAVAGLSLRADAAAYRLPELLLGTPVVTVNQVAKGLGVAFPAANRALIQLQDLGILESVKEQK